MLQHIHEKLHVSVPAVLCCAVLCCAVLCCAVLCCAAALCRYTECRLAAAAEDMLLDDLEANTVDFAPTFDASQVSTVCFCSKVHAAATTAAAAAAGSRTCQRWQPFGTFFLQLVAQDAGSRAAHSCSQSINGCRLPHRTSYKVSHWFTDLCVLWLLCTGVVQDEPLVLPAKVPHLLVNGTQVGDTP